MLEPLRQALQSKSFEIHRAIAHRFLADRVDFFLAFLLCSQGIAKLADFGCSKQFQGVRTPVSTQHTR